MPWCHTCNEYRLSADLKDDGGCPECEQVIGKPHKTPWHFKLLVVAVVAYLVWRIIQMISWLF